MKLASLVRLITLAAIWGGAFLFTRICAPILGSVILIEYRVALSGKQFSTLYIRKRDTAARGERPQTGSQFSETHFSY